MYKTPTVKPKAMKKKPSVKKYHPKKSVKVKIKY